MAWLLWSRGRDEKPVAAMSHQTALSLFELGDFNPAKVHMSVPKTFRRNSPTPKAVVLHRTTLAPAEVTQLRGLTVCRPLRALCDLANANPDAAADLRPIAVEARRRGLITERELSAMKDFLAGVVDQLHHFGLRHALLGPARDERDAGAMERQVRQVQFVVLLEKPPPHF
jgi:hypothetical protein